MGKKSTLRRYSPEERERAVARAKEIGPSAAGKELGIPSGSISCWQYQARQRAAKPAPEARPAAGPAVGSSTPSVSNGAPRSTQKRVAKVYTPSQRAEALEAASQEGITAAANRLGMSRFSLHEWRRKVRLHADGKVPDNPLAGGDEDKAAVRDRRILAEWKTHPGLGPTQVRNQLRRAGLKVSVHTVRCVLETAGYVTPTARRVEVHDRRYEAVRPNHLWHLDFLHRFINKLQVYVLLILDDFSRYVVGGALWDGERVAAVQETFLSAVNRHGKPEKVMSDGGSAFYSWRGMGAFTRLLEGELEIDQLIATTPQNNGKLEALNANIQKELFDKEQFFDLGEAQRRFSSWVRFYNLGRTHTSMGGILVPADRYFGRVEEVMAAVEAGYSATGTGEPLPPGERHLDLFRVSSYRGQVEVSLLGHRLDLPFKPV